MLFVGHYFRQNYLIYLFNAIFRPNIISPKLFIFKPEPSQGFFPNFNHR